MSQIMPVPGPSQDAFDSFEGYTKVGLNDMGSAIAIVSVDNEHDAIAKGEYVYLRDSDYAPDGLYIANAAIAANASIAGKIDPVSKGVANALSDHLAQKQDKGSSGRLSQSVSVSSSWTYTGLSVTIPYGKIFGVSGYQLYNATAPTGMALSNSNNSMQTYNSFIIEGCNQCAYTGFVHEPNGRTYYLWAKAGGTGNNNVALEYWYM